MGEAKRRKENLGNAYGQTIQPIIKGSEDLDLHVERFFDHWFQFLESTGLMEQDSELLEEDLPSASEDIAEKQQQTKEWIQAYLQPYRQQDRDKLACGILDPIYEDLADTVEVEEPDEDFMEQIMTWMVEATTYFGLLKPHISSDLVQRYQEPLQSFYNMVSEEAQANQNEEGLTLLQSIFADCLD